jgi:PAS domain S-box-containing protein
VNADLHQFAGLLDALACGAALIEPAGRIVHVNPRALAMMNLPRNQVVGQNVLDLYPQGDAADFVKTALADLSHPREGEFYVPRADGSRLPVVMSGRSWRADRGGKTYAVTMTDVSPLKEAEDSWKTRYRIIAELSTWRMCTTP